MTVDAGKDVATVTVMVEIETSVAETITNIVTDRSRRVGLVLMAVPECRSAGAGIRKSHYAIQNLVGMEDTFTLTGV